MSTEVWIIAAPIHSLSYAYLQDIHEFSTGLVNNATLLIWSDAHLTPLDLFLFAVTITVDIGIVVCRGEETEDDKRNGPDVLCLFGQIVVSGHVVKHQSPESQHECRHEDYDDLRWTDWSHILSRFLALALCTRVEDLG
jgi:hypothetical protein